MHKVAPAIEAAVDIPFLHIVDITAAAVCAAGIENVALLGTRFTMEQAFYRERLQSHGLKVMVPDAERSEEHTSELQSLMRISYAVFCLKKKKKKRTIISYQHQLSHTKH